MKTKEELKALKEKEVEAEGKEPRKLTDEELAQVSGGHNPDDFEPGGDERLPVKQRVDESDGGEDVPRSYAPIGAPSADTVEGIRCRR